MRSLRLRPGLAYAVEAGMLTAEQAVACERRLRREEAARRRVEEAREAASTAARERQAESDRMAPVWARWVMAHAPAFLDLVVHDGIPLRDVVERLMRLTGCPLDCSHRPLTPAQLKAFETVVAQDTVS